MGPPPHHPKGWRSGRASSCRAPPGKSTPLTAAELRITRRPGVSADWDAVFDVAARRQVAIEIDGSWDRQDVHYALAARALERGCLFALDSDAHAHGEYDFVDVAIAHAKLAGIPEKRIVNYWSDEQILAWAKGAWER